MKFIIKELVFIVRSIFFIPHLILFLCSRNRQIIEHDIVAMEKSKSFCKKGIPLLIYLLEYNKYFRTLFYVRIGSVSSFVKWYSAGESTFFVCENIGGGVYLAHPFATILNAKKIGKNFTCRQCTTIGNKRDGDNENLPIIGDNVILGANVVVIGNINIGNNVVVGAGSVVVKNVPDNCIVAGNPAKIIRKIL